MLKPRKDEHPEINAVKSYVRHLDGCAHHAKGACSCGLYDRLATLSTAFDQAASEGERLRKLINTPQTAPFFNSVQLEAAHQVERWGTKHDDTKDPHDWFWLLGFLAGKALSIPEKQGHHIISSAACLLNWYRNVTGDTREFNPGWRP